MIDWLKDLFRPIRTRDVLFGDMRYLRQGRIWEGHALFAPVARPIEVLVVGGRTGPSTEQREFFRAVEQRYDGLASAVQLLLEKHRENAPPEASFVLVGVELPDEPGEAAEWNLLYETDPPGWFYSVKLQGWSVLGIGEEC